MQPMTSETEARMGPYYWNSWYAGWGWFLWFAVMILLLSSIGHWGYTYRAYRRYGGTNLPRTAIDVLSERYARGEITREEYLEMSTLISERQQQHAALSHAAAHG